MWARKRLPPAAPAVAMHNRPLRCSYTRLVLERMVVDSARISPKRLMQILSVAARVDDPMKRERRCPLPPTGRSAARLLCEHSLGWSANEALLADFHLQVLYRTPRVDIALPCSLSLLPINTRKLERLCIVVADCLLGVIGIFGVFIPALHSDSISLGVRLGPRQKLE